VHVGLVVSNIWPTFSQTVDQLWYYRVAAYNANGTNYSTNTSFASVVLANDAIGLWAISSNVVVIEWENRSTTVDSNVIERATDTNWSDSVRYYIGAVKASTNSAGNLVWGNGIYTNDSGILEGITYHYRVRAYKIGLGEGAGNLIPSSVTPWAAPLGPYSFSCFTTESAGQLRYQWRPQRGTDLGFRVDKSFDAGVYWITNYYGIAADPDASGYNTTDSTGLVAGSNVWYRICSSNSVGMSPWLTQHVRMPNAVTDPTTNWYVSLGATNGNNTGTNWADAWTGIGSINWPKLSNGHTVFISGGGGTSTYNNMLYIWKSGVPGSDLAFRAATNGPESGVSVFTHIKLPEYRTNIMIDGSRFNDVTCSHGKNLPTTNIGFRVEPNDNDNAITIFTSTGNKVRWTEICNAGYLASYSDIKRAAINGIYYNITKSNNTNPTDCEVSFCYIHDNRGDGITGSIPNSQDGYGRVSVHHNLICTNGDDGIEFGGSGFDIYNNDIFMWHSGWGRGDQDCVQLQCSSYIRVYNNYLHDIITHELYPNICGEVLGDVTPEQSFAEAWRVYNNVMYIDILDNSSGCFQQTISGDAAPSYRYDSFTVKDYLVANNTFKYIGTASSLGRRTDVVTNCFLTNVVFANNLFWNPDSTMPGGCVMSVRAPTTNWFPPYVMLDRNVFRGPRTNIEVSSALTLYTPDGYFVASGLSNRMAWDGFASSVGDPSLSNVSSAFFMPVRHDIACRYFGTNLSSWSDTSPGLMSDIEGNPRPAAGNWDVGAYQSGTLQVHFTFEDSFDTLGYTTNYGWLFTNGIRGGKPETPISSNWPARVACNTTPGSHSNGYCAEFTWYNGTDWSDTGKEGDYVAITEAHGLTNVSTMTLTCWARYYESINHDYMWDQNAELMSAGMSASVPGSWTLGRETSSNTKFCIKTNATTWIELDFPDYAPRGDTTNWHHYAATWSNGIATIYFDGSLIESRDVSSALTNLSIGVGGDAAGHPWIGIGCHTHAGTYLMENESGTDYPNHAWMNGVIDDVMIYTESLSESEIAEIAESEDGSEPANVARATSVRLNATTIRGM